MELNKIYNEDFNETLKRLDNKKIDLIITDPPYPDFMVDEYDYYDGILNFLKKFKCKQLIFWSAKASFPLSYTAIHIWDKARGVGTMYERIFERNGCKGYKFYRGQKYNNKLDAIINRDVLTEHPSQKPIKLISKLLIENSNENDIIFDPFLGSGTLAIACIKYKRNYIASEISKNYFDIANKRIQLETAQLKLF